MQTAVGQGNIVVRAECDESGYTKHLERGGSIRQSYEEPGTGSVWEATVAALMAAPACMEAMEPVVRHFRA